MYTRPLRAAHCRGVADSIPPTASTSAPCSMRYVHASARPLIAAQRNGVILSSSLSVARARPDSIKARIRSVLPSCAATKMSSCVHRMHYRVSFGVYVNIRDRSPRRELETHLSMSATGFGRATPGGSVKDKQCHLDTLSSILTLSPIAIAVESISSGGIVTV